jgi:hypothetical protein
MFAIDLQQARNIAIGIVVVLAVLAFLSAWLIKSVVSKVITVGLMALLAFAVWTQRASLDDCADRLRAKADVGDFSETTCSFFGADVTIPGVDRPGVPSS